MDERDQWAGLRIEVDRRIQQPTLAVLAERALNRGRQRTTRMAGIAVTVAVLLAVPLISMLVGRTPVGQRPQAPAPFVGSTQAPVVSSLSASQSPVDRPPTSASTPAVTATTNSDDRPVTSIVQADFFDQDHGFAMLQRCPTRRVPCTTVLAVTDDGRTWTERSTPVPPTVADGDPSPFLEVLGSSQVVLRLPGRSAIDAGQAWFSTNAGQTWTDVGMKVTEHISALPDGAVLAPECAIPSSECWTPGTVRLPVTGALATLDGQPGFMVENLIQGAEPGMWLMVGRSGSIDHPEPVVARSTDHGRSWTTATLPGVGSQFFALTISRGGSTWYAAAIGQYPDVKNGLLAIYRSTDDGRTWTVTWRVHAQAEPRSLLGGLIAGGGQLLANTESGKCFVSRTDGRTFTPTTCPPIEWTTWTRNGYLSTLWETGTISRSVDGLHWSSTKP